MFRSGSPRPGVTSLPKKPIKSNLQNSRLKCLLVEAQIGSRLTSTVCFHPFRLYNVNSVTEMLTKTALGSKSSNKRINNLSVFTDYEWYTTNYFHPAGYFIILALFSNDTFLQPGCCAVQSVGIAAHDATRYHAALVVSWTLSIMIAQKSTGGDSLGSGTETRLH